MKRKVLKRVGIGFGSLIILLVLLFVSVTMIYPAVLRWVNRIDSPPGIDAMEVVEIGGIPQALYFRGQDVENPVVLFIHGGPGFPVRPFLHDFQYAWEEYYTIVHWDQRNVGETFFLSDPEVVLETLSFDRILADAYEVTQYIRERLGQDRIIVLGYSWGSVVGTALVQTYPQYFSAYIGVGQAVNFREAEHIGFEALLQAVRDGGNGNHIASVEALAPYPPNRPFDEDLLSQMFEVRLWQTRYGLAWGGGFRTTFLALTSPHSSSQASQWLARDNTRYHIPLFRFLVDEFDARDFGTTFEIPMFFIMGEWDYQTPHIVAREFYEEISAPHKAFFLIPNAGHGAMHDNAPEFNRVLLEEIRPLIMAG